MDEDIFEEEASLDDVIDTFMKSTPGEETPPEDDIENDSPEDEDESDEDLDDENQDDDEDENDDEDSDEDLDDDSDDKDDTDDEPKADLADEAHEVEFTVDGEVQRVSVKDLKRLAGQEASLTQKSQSLATQRTAIDRQGQAAALMINRQYEKAVARAKQYETVDLFVASRELEAEEFDALRKEKQEAEADVKFFEQEAETFLKTTQEAQDNLTREQAKEAVKVLAEKIPEWNDELYAEIRTYGVSQGLDQNSVNRLVDPSAIILMHKARLYDLAKEKAKTVSKKIVKAPKKVIKKADEASNSKTKRLTKTQRAAAATGDLDDVAAAFMAASN